ncbi:MAG: enoyl-CoA hydratase-related protein [Rudaea sp.]|uniref:enoyl-CoA hydratase/isomerase family protein n=1 Tax=Rudaea sp. TaxID=2136325 RepID=UPI0039E63152
MNDTSVLLTREHDDGRIVVLTLNRPAALNAIDDALAQALEAEAQRLAHDGRVEAVVLTGAGRAFSSGGDIGSFKSALAGGGFGELPALLDRLATRVHGAIETLSGIGSVLITAVNGSATGGGLGLACAGDVAYAQPGTTLRPGFARLGLSPDSGTTYQLARLIGYRRALEFLLRGEPLAAPEALKLGLFNEIIDADGEAFVAQAVERARKLIASGRAARETRRLLRHSPQASLHEQLELEKASLIALAQDERAGALLKQALGL